MGRPSSSPGRALDPLTGEQVLVSAGVMVALMVAALDTTVVGTAMPTIIGRLGGLSEYSWVFSGYLLTATTTVPLYAKLADIHGRKPIFLLGIFLFVGGSALCGLSTSMLELIAFRTLQGLGAGAVQPIAYTIVGDIFQPERRARMQGYFSGVWGVSAIIGPAMGGIITQTVGWPWVFEVNIPVGMLAAVIIVLTFHERFERRPHRLDWAGATLLTLGVALLLFSFSEAGDLFGWSSPAFVAVLAGSIALLGAFVAVERRSAEPIVQLALIRDRLIGTGLVVTTLAGVVMYGLTTYVPPMIQGVQGDTPVAAGAAVAAMAIGWPLGSVIGGRALIRWGVRPAVLVGTVMLVVGSATLTQLGRFDQLWVAMVGSAVTGLGMGLATTSILVVLQGAVDWGRRGVVTGLVQFSRTIGGAVGIGLMGGILAAFVGSSTSAILDPLRNATLPRSVLIASRGDLAAGLFWIFVILVAAALVALVVAWRAMPAVGLEAASPVGSGGHAASLDAQRAADPTQAG
jgi:EmrB/QacA subfamily drug resistance transporter